MTEIHKFCSINQNTLKTLINEEIWFGNPVHFNDPLDCIINLKITKYPEISQIDSFYNDYERITGEKIDLKQKKKEFEKNPNIFEEDYKKFWDHSVQRLTGVTCFSARYQETLMWSHYADSHQGICLIFDQDKLIFSDSNVQLSPVNYPPVIPVTEINAAFDQNEQIDFDYMKVLTTKYVQWSYEEEIRAILPYQTPNIQKTVGFNISALVGVIFGFKCSESNIKTIMKILDSKDHSITYYKAKIGIKTGIVEKINYSR